MIKKDKGDWLEKIEQVETNRKVEIESDDEKRGKKGKREESRSQEIKLNKIARRTEQEESGKKRGEVCP